MTEVEKKTIEQMELQDLIKIDELKMAQYQFKLATSAEDYFAALKLVQDVYLKEGYVNSDESSCPCRILENHFYEKTAVFMGKKEEKLVFTVSLFPDSPNGLPMDSIYKKELDSLRDKGRMIGEVGCLATHPEFRDGSQNIPMHGNKIMLNYAMEYLKLDDLVITVHPRHAVVYKEVLMFDEIGKGTIKSHPKVNGNPAVALRLNLNEVEAKCRHSYQNNSLDTNLHHFLFVKQSRILQFPENNTAQVSNCNPFLYPGHMARHTGYPVYQN